MSGNGRLVHLQATTLHENSPKRIAAKEEALNVTRKIWNALGATLYLLLAAIFAVGAVGLAAATNLTIGQKVYASVVFIFGIIYLVASAIGVLRRKKN